MLVACGAILVRGASVSPLSKSGVSTVGPVENQTGFVYAKNGQLFTDSGEPYTRFQFEDTMRTIHGGFARAVLRTHT